MRSLYDFGDTRKAEAGDGKVADSGTKSLRSLVLAIASTVFFALCELPGAISTARSMQLLLAALLCAVLAAVHTHTVLGKNLSGWRLFQPFQGGTIFVLLQAAGWITFAAVCLGAIAVPLEVQGVACALGIVQLLGQAALLLSLAHFDPSQAGTLRTWSEEGIPFQVIGAVLIFAVLAISTAIQAGGAARRGAGWAILLSMLGMQGLGIHYMWTVTWNFLTLVCFLIESEEALAVMACIGVCSVGVPWYIGRIIYQRHDFCKRAMIGQSAWVCQEIFCLPERHLLHNHDLSALRVCFWHFDIVLHLLAAWGLLQEYAFSIKPVHVLGSLIITLFWFFTLFLHHNVLHVEAARALRFRMVPWGSSTLWQPSKVAQIYMFDNKHIDADTAWVDSVPGFAAIILLSHIVMAIVAALPSGGQMFFAFGLGYYVSVQSLIYFGCYCFFGAISCLGIGVSIVFRSVLSDTQAKAE